MVRLEIEFNLASFKKPSISLVPFYKFSDSVKSLHLCACRSIPCLQTLCLIHSLPLLENLTLDVLNFLEWGLPPASIDLSVSPPLTGTLEFAPCGGIELIACRLLDLPNGLHFQRLILSWHHEVGFRWTDEFVAACSSTLEYLDIMVPFFCRIVFRHALNP